MLIADELHGRGQNLTDLAGSGEFKVVMDERDGVVKMSVNRQPWLPLLTGSSQTVSLQTAYDGGRTINATPGPVAITTANLATQAPISLNGAQIFANAGAPSNANGNNGDLYIQTNNGLFQRQGGVWTAIGGGTLDAAYDFGGAGVGRTITADAGSVAINSAAADNNSLLALTKNPAGSQTGTVLTIVAAPGAAGGMNGLDVQMGAFTDTAGYAATFDWRGTAGTAAGNGIVNVEVGAATVLVGRLVGIECDLQTNVTPGANAVIGHRILIPATTRGSNSGEGALVISSLATAARVIDIQAANTTTASGTGLITVYYPNPVALTNQLTGCLVDLRSSVTGNNRTVYGYFSQIASAAGAGSAYFVAELAGLPSSGAVVGYKVSKGSSSQTVASSFTAFSAELATSLITNGATGTLIGLNVGMQAAGASNANKGMDYTRIGAPAAASTYTGAAINIQNAPTGTNNYNESSAGLITVNHAPIAGAGTITDTTTAVVITMTPAASSAVKGINIVMASTTSSSGYAATFDWRSTEGTTGGNGIVNVEVGAATTFAGVITGVECDMRSNINAATAVDLTCYTAKIAAALSGSTASFGFNYSRSGAPVAASVYGGAAVNIQNTPTGTNNYSEGGTLILINHAPVLGAGTITDTTTGIKIFMTPAAASAVNGAVITMSVDATGYGLHIVHNCATAGVGTVALRLSGADESVAIEMTDGDTVGLSNAGEGRIIYNGSTNKFQISENGGAYVNMV